MVGDDPLIRASQLKSVLDAHMADVVVIEASWATLDEADDYRAGHIPGTIHLDTDALESGYPHWLLRPPNELQEVLGPCGDEATWLADARSAAAYTGDTSGYDYLDRKGRLPQSIHIGDANAAAHIYTRPDGGLRPLDEIRALWVRTAICSTTDPSKFDRDVIFYCGSGWRSSLAFFFAWRMGYRNIRNYSDGFCGWSTGYEPDARTEGSTPGWRQYATDNPVVTGDG